MLLPRKFAAARPFVFCVLLCLLGGSRWLLEGANPTWNSTPSSAALGVFLAAAAFELGRQRYANIASGRPPLPGRTLLRSAVGGALIFGGVATAQLLAGSHLHGDALTLAAALTPAVIAVASPALQAHSDSDLVAGLWPGLAGLAGLMLLLPQPHYADWRPWVGLTALPLMAGVGAVLLRHAMTRSEPQDRLQQVWASLAGASAGGACLLLVAVLPTIPPWHGGNMPWGAVLLDFLTVGLSLLWLATGGAARWSAQFLLIPLLALAESLVLLRPLVDGRSWCGLALLLVSAARQLGLKEEALSGRAGEAEDSLA